MSTEAPPIEPEVIPAQPVPSAPESLIKSIRVLRADAPAAEPAVKEPETPKEPEAKEPEKKTEPATEPVKEEPKAEPVKDETVGMSEKAAARFKRQEVEKLKAIEERDKIKAEVDTYKKQAEEAAAQLRDIETIKRDAQKAQEEVKTYREQLRLVNLERDPEFQRKFNGEILTRQQQMLEMAVEAGTEHNVFVEAINKGDEDTLSDIRDSLPQGKRLLWDANRVDIERIAFSKKEALKNAQKTTEQLNDERKRALEEQAARMKAENISVARNTVDALWKEIPDLDKAGLEVKEEIQSWLSDMVVNAEREQLVRQLAVGQITQKVVDAQASELTKLNDTISQKDAEIAEMKEKLAELETFVKEAQSHQPRPKIAGNSSPESENGSLLSRVRVQIPGR